MNSSFANPRHLTRRLLPGLLFALALIEGTSALFAAGAIQGVVKYTGPAVRVRAIRMSADPKCEAMHKDPAYDDSLLISENGGVANAFVALERAPDGTGPFAVPEQPARLVQKACSYEPKVQGVMVKQSIDIVNDDPTLHNVRCLARDNRPFNLGQPSQGTRSKFFTEPERAIKFKCDVHPWMTAYIFSMDHPFFAVSDNEGKFTIANVPPGQYKLIVWHEKLGEQETQVTVSAQGGTATFTFDQVAAATP